MGEENMHTISKEELEDILEKHDRWLRSEKDGERAYLSETDLSEADLKGADLRGANLRGADLSEADLRWANLRGADLSEANLRGTDLSEANLRWANLRWANLRGVDLSETDLRKVNLSEADLRGADLRWANLRGADLSETDLSEADLSEANLSETDLSEADLSETDLRWADLRGANLRWANLRGAKIDFPIACPEKGSFTAFKKAGGYIVELLVHEDALRSSATARKCRCSKAKVVSITNYDGSEAHVSSVYSSYDPSFIYSVGEVVEVPNFDTDRWNECAPGIHFFITRQEAVYY